MKRLLLLHFIVLISVIGTTAQPLLKYTEYTSGNVLEHSRVSNYAQDSRGMLWLGTWIGLCRYDGRQFHFFRPELSDSIAAPLGSNRVLKLVLDSHDNVWCLNNDQAIYRFDRATSTYQAALPLARQLPSRFASARDRIYVAPLNHAVWVVLEDGSLVRYIDHDLADNVTLPCPPDQSHRIVYEVHEDTQGREWILTDRGVIIYGQGVITETPFSRMVEQNGRLFFTVDGRETQLAEYTAQNEWRYMPLPATVHQIASLQTLGHNHVSVGTDDGLVVVHLPNDSISYVQRTTDGHSIGRVSRALYDCRGRVWMLSDARGVYCLARGAAQAQFLPEPRVNNPMLTEAAHNVLLMKDGAGVVWVKPGKGELCWVDESTMTLHHHSECLADGRPLPVTDYNCLFVDRQKNLWISNGTKVCQVVFGRRQFEAVPTLTNIEVRALLPEGRDYIWHGDKVGYLGRYDFKTSRHSYLTPQGKWSDQPVVFNGDGIYCLLRDSQQRIWVGTRGSGIYCLTPQGNGYTVSHFRRQPGAYQLNCNNIYDFCQDEYGRLWVATFGGGINLMQPQPDGKVRFVHAGNDLKHYPLTEFDVVRSLTADGRGRILAGTNQGILTFSTQFDKVGDITFYVHQAQQKQPYALQDNMVMRTLCDNQGTCYVSTYARGLSRVEGEGIDSLRFVPLPNRAFPAGDVAMTAAVSSRGHVWQIAECGITDYDPQSGCMSYYDQHEFDRFYTISECAPVELANGKMVLGILGGMFIFAPDSLRKSSYAPQMVLTERHYAEGTESYQQDLNDVDTLMVLPNQRSASLSFAAVDLVPSRLIRYAYWMQAPGHPTDCPHWVYTNNPAVNFTNLQPGEYSLHLRSTNSDGVWTDNERVISLEVVPTFAEQWTWLFLTILGVILTLLILHYVQHRVRVHQEEMVRMEVSAARIEMLASPTNKADQEFIQKLMQVLESHLSDGELQVNDLADDMNMSRATLYRRLKQAVDLSPNDFIHQVRMRRSAELLTQTTDSIAQIAYSVGFNNPKYFSKCFRQDYGVSPAEYRNREKNKA